MDEGKLTLTENAKELNHNLVKNVNNSVLKLYECSTVDSWQLTA